MNVASRLVCHGCGAKILPQEPLPFTCPGRTPGDDVDHVLSRVLNGEAIRREWAESGLTMEAWVDAGQPQPFNRYRRLLHVWHAARARGVGDQQYVELVERLDGQLRNGGCGFGVTPLLRNAVLEDAIRDASRPERFPGVWVKDETRNVAGSHKARHLFGVLLHLALLKEEGQAGHVASAPLAISSCGNAALAAATVAQAGVSVGLSEELLVFVPEWGDAGTIEQLRASGAQVSVCAREEGEVGDPCYHAFREAVAAGALPFCCQGSENALTIDGGRTLAYEMVEQLGMADATVDRVFLQVGGGAFASAVVQGLDDLSKLGVIEDVPRIYAVQAAGGAPLDRAFRRVVADGGVSALPAALGHRSRYMWPWEEAPFSVATGILDDETYDWGEVVAAMLRHGGETLVVGEARLRKGWELARSATDIPVCATGSVGLAGVLEVVARGDFSEGENVAVVFTGVER